MKNEAAITINGLSKTFRITKQGLPIWKRFISFDENQYQNIHALREVSLEIRKGEMIGIIGKNGSGKSTLLKIILGALDPDQDNSIQINGDVIRLAIDLHLDEQMSTKDNIYLNGAMLGIETHLLDREMNNILSFAELQSYKDSQVKYYSTGMKTRLAFSIAMLAEADIYLIDEFFAEVGDVSFRKKALRAFKEKAKKGKTVLHVTHNMELLEGWCDRIYVLDKGIVTAYTDELEAFAHYHSK